jgi:predicted GH43/DUF377 family glycosyl hydrolase
MPLVQRTPPILEGDPHRVLCRIFIPGDEELIRGTPRVTELITRFERLTDDEVSETLDDTLRRFGPRHRDLVGEFEHHFAAVCHLIPHRDRYSPPRRQLLGSYLTQEYALESTAYFNPSLVAHPDQADVPPGSVRFVMSVRAVGEGHQSSLVFRTGTISADCTIDVDPPSAFATNRASRSTVLHNRFVEQAAIDADLDMAELQFALGMLPKKFTLEELTTNLHQLLRTDDAAAQSAEMIRLLQQLALDSYEVDFDETTELSERVLWPTSSDERRGIEDARFVRFVDDDGDVTYRATYTGFDGSNVVSRLLETEDFRTFSSSKMTGGAVRNKGVALFPRRIAGRYVALSRWDRESNSIAFSDDGYHWHEADTIHVAADPWELIHVGNCGSPIETEHGWLVITHGAGPMRQYALGAMLLDLHDPVRVLATFPGPLLRPTEEERNGYVPNVVYSCGGVAHQGRLILPFGFSDCRSAFAVIDIEELIERMEPVTRSTRGRRTA